MLRCILMYVITLHQPDGLMVSHELTGDRCVVGRSARRADLVVVDPQVSAVQVEIGRDGDSLWLRDLGSSNGTALEGLLLEPHRQYPLETGQQVMIGGGSSLLSVDLARVWDATQVAPTTYKPRYIGVLYTDIVGSTRLTVALGHERATALLEWHNEMFRKRFKRFGGRETKYTGDGFEAVFTSVSSALACAAGCQRALARRNQEDSSGVRLDVRMGINAGEAPSVRNRVYGMPLIIAARVMSKATAGQVLVSAHVPAIVAGSLLRFSPFGVHELKGLPEPMPLLEYRWELDPNVLPPSTIAEVSQNPTPGDDGLRV